MSKLNKLGIAKHKGFLVATDENGNVIPCQKNIKISNHSDDKNMALIEVTLEAWVDVNQLQLLVKDAEGV